jgi:hypothetical protein
LAEGAADLVRVSAEVKLVGNITQAPQTDHLRKRPPLLIDVMVDDDRVEFIGELSGLAVPVTVRYDPFQLDLAVGGGLENLYVHIPPLREVMNRHPGEHSLSPDNIEGSRLRRGDSNGRMAVAYFVVGHLHFFFENISAPT